MAKYSDIAITCSQCGKQFVFSEDEQAFYKAKGYTPPLRCKPCRSIKKQQPGVCSKCGSALVEGSPIYCAACFIDVELEFEQKARGLKVSVPEGCSSLAAAGEKAAVMPQSCPDPKMIEEKDRLIAEAAQQIAALENEKSSLTELLKQKEQLIIVQEKRLDAVIAEMQSARSEKDSLRRSEPLLNGLKEKIEALEKNQSRLIELIYKLLEDNSGNHRSQNVLESFKTLFRSDRRSPA